MIENSPRPSRVRPTLKDVDAGCPATFPANWPAMITPMSDNNAAPIDSPTAPPKPNGSTVKPKPKKKIAPKKSRNGTTSFSRRALCSVSPRINPSNSAPIASATWIVSPSPAKMNNAANTTITNTSFDEMRNSRFSNGVVQRPITIKPTINPSASPDDDTMPPNEVAPLKTTPDSSDK